MDKSLVKSHERIRDKGEIFTPKSIVLRMLKCLSEEFWKDYTKTLIDPSCGTGNFLIMIIAIKIKMGSTSEQALSTTYGIDIAQDNIDECKERMLLSAEKYSGLSREQSWIDIVNHNVICGDGLKRETWEKFNK
jgi:type I restriction-modification system DNA methylase subunit